MPAIDLEQARRRLLAERERFDRQLGRIDRELHADEPIDTSTGDAGQNSARVEIGMEIEADVKSSLAEIAAALQRIEDGTYGFDEETGEPIDPERLEALPTARRNIR